MEQKINTIQSLLNKGLHQAFSTSDKVYLLGEDILDPYGGAFKVSQGLSTKYPDRVISTPISEAGITGFGAGMALRGLRPIIEIMFADFITLIADQLINHITKFRWMYNNQVHVPIIIRTPTGGRRGYGPTHSQSLEKIFLGIPGLQIFSVNNIVNPTKLLANLILKTEEPVLFLENKLLYAEHFLEKSILTEFNIQQSFDNPIANTDISKVSPTITLQIKGAPDSCITLCAYGYMAELARQAMISLAYEHEVFVDLIIPTQLVPIIMSPFLSSIQRTKRVLLIEETWTTMGWGSEIISRVLENNSIIIRNIKRLGAKDHPIPASKPLEEFCLPGKHDIIQACLQLLE